MQTNTHPQVHLKDALCAAPRGRWIVVVAEDGRQCQQDLGKLTLSHGKHVGSPTVGIAQEVKGVGKQPS